MGKNVILTEGDLLRFWSKVDRSNADGCWEWTAAKSPFGHGNFHCQNQMHRAHRISWVVTHGEIPNNSFVLHKCDNPKCCNPQHLFLGTQSDNVADMISKGRNVKSSQLSLIMKTHAARGDRNGMAKLNQSDVNGIRLLLRAGMLQKDIASLFSICQQSVSDIKLNRYWIQQKD